MHLYPVLPSPGFARRFERRLRHWFTKHRRDLPWRAGRDPYHIWVSEVMLQQTQVTTVIPFFHRFIEAFPTVRKLAAAPEPRVLRQWAGLGYYRRARDLHRAVRWILKHHAGQIPREPDVLARLPGIGRYLLGAILSQAFDLRFPILEANSLRVLARVFACPDDPKRGPVQRRLWDCSEALLPSRQVGDFNQALMELGALVCTPRRPKCDVCPVAPLCAARARGLEDALPRRAPAETTTPVREIAVVLRRGDKVLLVQRPPTGRWASFWEFPHGPVLADELHPRAARRVLRQLTGLRGRVGQRLAMIRHSVTRYRIEMSCHGAEFTEGDFRSAFYVRHVWVGPRRCVSYPLPAAMRRLAELL